ncbi:MAG: LysE family translocator [Methylibium sp.]|nr:LysE family translocator [Methylibium sp.]
MNELLPLMTYCFVMSSTPGPNNLMITATGANVGYRGALPLILGINTGVALQTFVCCLGLGQLFLAYPDLHTLLRIAGALYLVYLAWRLCRSPVGKAQAAQSPGFVQGLLFQAVNPKSWVKSVTLASVFMPAGMDLMAGALLVTVVGSLIGLPCTSTWACFGMAIRHWLREPRRQRAFNLLMGGTLVVLALMFLR